MRKGRGAHRDQRRVGKGQKPGAEEGAVRAVILLHIGEGTLTLAVRVDHIMENCDKDQNTDHGNRYPQGCPQKTGLRKE